MATIQDAVGGLDFSGAGGVVTMLIYIFIIAVVVGVLGYVFMIFIRYNKKIIVFENVGGEGYMPIGKDRAMTVKVGEGGEEVLYLQKRKVYRSAYGKKMGKRTYWFAIGSDGYWYNITLQDLDKKMGSLGINPVDRDMRYMHVAIRRNIKERYEQTSWLAKYGGMIAYIMLIAMTGVMMWLLFDKYLSIAGDVNTAISAAGKVQEETAKIIGALDNICVGGKGF